MVYICFRYDIEKRLKPRLEQKQAVFEAFYNDPSQFKERAIQVYSKTDDLRSVLYEIETL